MKCENCNSQCKAYLSKISNSFSIETFIVHKDNVIDFREYLVTFCPKCGDLRINDEDWKKLEKFCKDNNIGLENIG